MHVCVCVCVCVSLSVEPHTYIYIYIYIYIYVCVCVCVCVWFYTQGQLSVVLSVFAAILPIFERIMDKYIIKMFTRNFCSVHFRGMPVTKSFSWNRIVEIAHRKIALGFSRALILC